MKWKVPVLMLCASLLWSAPALAEAPESSNQSDRNSVEGLVVEEEDDGTYIHIQGTEEATFSVFKLDEPPRLFVDLSNSELADDQLNEEVYNGVISEVGLVEFEDGFQDVARLVVGFETPAHYDVSTDGDDVVVFIDGEQRRDDQDAVAQQQLDDRQAEYDDTIAELKQQQQQLKADQSQELQQLKAERDKLKAERDEQLQQLKAERDEARQNHQQAQRRAQQAQQELSELEDRLGDMDEEVAGSEERIDEQTAQLQQAQQRTERLEAELEDARQQQDTSGDESEEVAQQRRQLEEARDQASQAQQQLEEAEAERQQFQQARAEYQQKLDEAQQQATQREDEVQQARQAAEQAREQNETLAKELQQRDAEIAQLKEDAKAAEPDGPEMQAVPVDPEEDNAVRGVRLETGDDGRSQIVVDLDRPGKFTTGDADQDGRSVMVLNDVDLPDDLEQTLSSDTESGAVRFVSSFEKDDGTVHMEADLRSDASEVIRQEGNSVVWEFAPEANGQDAAPEQPAQPEHAQHQHNPDEGSLAEDHNPERPTDGDSVTSAPPNYPQVVTDPTEVTSVPGMGTQPLTIDLRNADIENVLRLISSESGVNIIAGDDVSGMVTMKLEGVPLDEAFLTILQSLRLGYEIRGNVVRVAPQEILQEEEQERAEARARAQEVEPLEVFMLPINYASASELTGQVEGLLSPRGTVSVDDRTNTLIITDLADNLQSIRMLVETLDAQVPQVLIEARIVETNENFDREVGIQWGGDFSMSQGSGNPTGLIFPNVLGVSGGATDGEAPVEGTSENPNYAVNLPATAGTGQGGALGLTMGSVGGAVNLNMRLSAMEDAGYAKIISAPRIMTLDNREATISQGTSIPISVVSAAGVQTIFVDATLELTVTPHVTPDGNVRMAIEATKNEPDFQNTGAQGDPTIIQNQAETELLVDDGDTTVIGGIYTENTGESISAVPFLHRIPILGFLFKSHSETENRSELLIFITPRIVNRAEALGIMSTGAVQGIEATEPAGE